MGALVRHGFAIQCYKNFKVKNKDIKTMCEICVPAQKNNFSNKNLFSKCDQTGHI